MAVDILLLALGVALAILTLRDVFDTVVVPGSSRTSLKVTHRVGVLLLAVWKRVRGGRKGVSGSFAPLVLVSSFFIWMSLLALAFGLMAHAARFDFSPPLATLGDSIYLAGSALATVGLSPHFPTGAARWIIVAAGFCGLAVMTMAVTYLLEVQSGVTRRDTGIIKLNTSAGQPPSGLALLERYAAIRHRSAIADVLDESRNWCATVRESHSVHPSMIYFQSVATGTGWPAALGAVLDLALIAEHLIDDERLYGPAILLKEEGLRMANELARMIGIRPMDLTTDESALRKIAQRLEASGYPVCPDPDFAAMARQRSEYASRVDALADHLGKAPAVLLPIG